MMRGEMLRYFRRQLKKAVLLSESQVHLNFLGTLPYKNVMQTNEICQHT
jgi:hypothetical protein